MTCWFRVAGSVERKMVMFQGLSRFFLFFLSMVFVTVKMVVGEGDALLLV